MSQLNPPQDDHDERQSALDDREEAHMRALDREDRKADYAPAPELRIAPRPRDDLRTTADGMVRQIEAFLAEHRVAPSTRSALEETRATLKRLAR